MNWLSAEFELFKVFENDRYGHLIKTPFQSVEDLVKTANSILNRRKSRAGKSLEHHLAEVFKVFDLAFDEQPVTEDKKTPDFIFPGESQYHDPAFQPSLLTMLGVKTSCKDRWRQVLSEAERIENKHLFTLEPAITENQTEEMKASRLQLVLPFSLHNTFQPSQQPWLMSLSGFIRVTDQKQKRY